MPEPDRRQSPEGDRREDAWSRERITEVLKASIRDRKWLRRHVRYIEAAVAVFGATIVVSVGVIAGVPGVDGGPFGDGGLIGKNKDRADESKVTADRLADLVGRIQGERRRNIRQSCRDTNRRHRKTVRKLDGNLRRLPPEQQAAAQAGRQFTVDLIDTLAPLRDCGKVVRVQARSTSGPTGPTGPRGATG